MAPYSTGRTFVNMHGAPSSVEDRARPWEKATYDRLVQTKESIDPTNTFRFGHSLTDTGTAIALEREDRSRE
jgi:hypothetical protein